MIKSESGTIEVKGLKPIIMAEFSSLLEALRRELGEEDYNRVLQDVSDSKQFGVEPKDSNSEDKETDFEPHLSFGCTDEKILNYGRIGDETKICDIAGRKLSVGDTVNLYNVEDNGWLDFRGEKSIVKDDYLEFVMGLRGIQFDRGVSYDHFGWVIILNRRHTEIKDGEAVNCIKYIKSERTGK